MEPPSLTLCSQGLLSKWGFNDGDMPEILMDYWDELDIPYPNWRLALCAIVRRYLLPELAKRHEVEVEEIETSHNPIRATVVDGVEIDDTSGEDEVVLTPELVTVPYPAVARACGLL